MANIETQLLELLNEKHPEYNYESSTDFIGDGLLDSFDIVLITADLEAKFGITIPGECILPENFASIAAIADLINRLLRAQSA